MEVQLLCAILLPLLLVMSGAQNVDFSITNFAGADMVLEGNCSVTVATGQFLQLIVNASDPDQNAGFGLGSRAVYATPVQLYDAATGAAASFNTSFFFRMKQLGLSYPKPGTLYPMGDGMTFIIAADRTMPLKSNGGALALFDSEYVRKDPNIRVVAVEFDTFYNRGVDPVNDSNHVGLDINDYASVKTQNLSDYGITLRDDKGFTAWIDYDAGEQQLLVYMAISRSPKSNASLVLYYSPLNLSTYVKAQSYVGFTATTGKAVQNTNVYDWNFSTSGLPEGLPGVPQPQAQPPAELSKNRSSSNKSSTGLVAGVASGGALLALAVSGVCCFYFCNSYRSSRTKNEHVVEGVRAPMRAGASTSSTGKSSEPSTSWDWDDGDVIYGPRVFTYQELKMATAGFSSSQILGQGGFGKVYLGVIRRGDSRSGTQLAIKRISRDSSQGEREFRSELRSLGQLRHKNLVQLYGWCQEQEELLLVYQYMPNSSLDRHLYTKDGRGVLPWTNRFHILQGVAAALVYIHTEWQKCILHRDIKPSNVMLDARMNGRLGDFGLARLVEDTLGTGMSLTAVAGTAGYMAPEFATAGKATAKSDVFSFGVLLLEVACGKKPQYPVLEDQDTELVEWVWLMHAAGNLLAVVDPALDGKFHPNEMICVLHVGLLCTHPDLDSRPSTKRVQQMLSGDVGILPLPRSNPIAVYGSSLQTLVSPSPETPCLQS